ncbi:Triacylglycerol esterase/lipase EstA, alpha/beta hydrolase fold [Nocardioides scoriae]|uniref:Triacylglycerol esterase/lipase EstA, alpha/beta hydrolase fold n=1 Tax=Nocardioides scoriae TaxID=642780 RepID=A0A1H1LRW3_9ACTN|nr:alpha/beta fold hydrolase [Nocardioides scoriae]SDR77338.1 Triacylglycerol esterase/lipase EstA, alpha/beta hydrolase fold [Nocardioides scoriae]
MSSRASTLDAAALAADYAEDLVVGTIRDVHGAVAGRLHGINDRLQGGGPTLGHRLHDGIARCVYSGISLGLKAGARGLEHAGRRGLGGPLEATPQGRFLSSAVNGLIGDRLVEQGHPFAFDMGVRVGDEDVVLDAAGVAAAFPAATGKVVVFVHGLCENESFWSREARPRREHRQDRRSYGERLADEDGWTPVFVRVNTGLPVAQNAVAMAALLDRLLEHWPVEVRRLALVGHSMGGLVLRAACAVTTDRDTPWTELVTDVVCLGTPHLGAPLERVVNHGVGALGRLPEAAPFGRILEYRSVGILDLRHGLARDVQNLPRARYRLVAATMTASPRSVTAGSLGDLLVPYASAMGRPRRGEEMFPGAETLHIRGDHFDLLNHDRVYEALRGWLRDRTDPPTRDEAAG